MKDVETGDVLEFKLFFKSIPRFDISIICLVLDQCHVNDLFSNVKKLFIKTPNYVYV